MHGCHATGQGFQQLIQIAWVFGEEIAVFFHEAVKVWLLAVGSLFQHLVEVGEHVFDARHVLGREVLGLLGYLLHEVFHHLLAELVEQLVEALLSLRRGEFVVLKLAKLPGEVGRQHVQLHLLFGERVEIAAGAVLVVWASRLRQFV